MATKLQQAAAAAKTTVRAVPPKERTDPKGVLTTTTGTPLAVLPGIDLEADAGMGLEGADKDSFAIPFLAVLQGLSPQLKTVEGARPGLIINTVTEELFKELRMVPVAFQRRYNRWMPRASGGGFKGTLTVSEVEGLILSGAAKTVKRENGAEVMMYGETELRDTRNHFVLLVEKGSWSPALISLASTQIKRSKRLMALIQNIVATNAAGRKFNPPSFANVYRVGTESDSNAKGEWEAFTFEVDAPVTDPVLYKAAKEFHGQIVSGEVQVASPPVEDDGGGDATGKF